MPKSIDPVRKMIRMSEISVRLGVNRSTIYRWIKRGQFPKPAYLANRVTAFYESDIREWQKKRAALATPPLQEPPEPDDGPLDDDAMLLDEDVLPARR